VLVLPSDHVVEREAVLRESLERAYDELRRAPRRVMLLGITPEHADPDYGWIVLADSSAVGPPATLAPRAVESFTEKPDPAEARRLLSRGALWSSFIFAARARTLIAIYRSIHPRLLRAYLARARAAAWDPAAPLELEGLPACDFSCDLLQPARGDLRVLVVPACGWTDLGTPERVAAWRDRRPMAVST
jgi:mannose-1-phosphate guanylyltransferase